jgi:putative membrane protein
MGRSNRADWILRFIKGIFIGSGFILPGVSGGALAAVFGIYERIITFLSDIRRDFVKNVVFFIPVGLGACAGVFVFSFLVSYVLGNAETYTMWFFIGCILGMLPALFKQSAKQGREPWHLGLTAAVCAGGFALLKALEGALALSVTGGIFTWLMAGAIIGLGIIVPGLSPSNLLVYMGLYKPMADGIKALDPGVSLPLILGAAACVILLSKLMNYIFSKAYAVLYHCILGIVFASTLVIVPFGYNYFSVGGLICLLCCAAGALLALGMSSLEARYKPED